MTRPILALLLTASGLVSCNSIIDHEARWKDDVTGTHQFGVSSGWAFVEADVELTNGEGPLANPAIGGEPEGASSTDLDPVFGLGLKYFYYLTNNWSFGGIYEHRIFDPESTRPLSADVDIDDFGTDHFILDLRYTLNARGRWRPFAGIQFGYVPEVVADGTVSYGSQFAALGFDNQTERIRLEGDEFFTFGIVGGASYLIREGLSFDFGAFYEVAIDETEDVLELTPVPGVGTLGETTSYDGSLKEEGLYLTFGLSWYF